MSMHWQGSRGDSTALRPGHVTVPRLKLAGGESDRLPPPCLDSPDLTDVAFMTQLTEECSTSPVCFRRQRARYMCSLCGRPQLGAFGGRQMEDANRAISYATGFIYLLRSLLLPHILVRLCSVMSTPSPLSATVLTVVLALVCAHSLGHPTTHLTHDVQASHQTFRKHETYNILVHAGLLLGPPGLVALLVTSQDPSASLFGTTASLLKLHLATLSLSVATYRISPLHPLARYPGPYHRRISHLVSAFISIPGNRSRHFAALHKTYGDVVRSGETFCVDI